MDMVTERETFPKGREFLDGQVTANGEAACSKNQWLL